jgi:hypothetical protein
MGAAMAKAFDLPAAAKNKYRLVLDESWDCVADKSHREPRDWYWQIPCRFKGKGTGDLIYIHGTNSLGAYTARASIMDRLAAMGKVHQRGDFEITVVFDPSRLDEVCDLMQAKRKRRVSEKQRAHLAAVGAESQFQRH